MKNVFYLAKNDVKKKVPFFVVTKIELSKMSVLYRFYIFTISSEWILTLVYSPETPFSLKSE